MADNSGISQNRIYGIDLLRIIATFFIITLHILGFGGLINNNEMVGYQPLLWFIYIITFCGVDCYAIISGFVCYDSKYRAGRIVEIWLQIVFYTLMETLIFSVVSPELITGRNWIKACFPILSGEYWYMSAYFILFLIMPLLNRFIAKCSNAVMGSILFCLLIVYMSIKSIWKIDFHYSIVSSIILLVSLYLLGAFLKKNREYFKLKWYQGAILFFAMIIVTYITRVMNCYMFIRNDSPSIVFASLGLFIIFVNIKIVNRKAIEIIRFLASSTMSVYIIHTNRLIIDNVIKNVTEYTLTIFEGTEFLGISILILGIYMICLLIDKVRICLFHIIKSTCRIKEWIGLKRQL